MDFANRVAIVTGASQGIGKAIALSYAKSSANVAIFDMNYDAACKASEEIRSFGVESDAYCVNVTSRKEVSDAVHKVKEKYGKIDILVNCAGVVDVKPFLEVTDNDWDFIMNVNLRGTFHTCHEVFPVMVENNYGKILNIASIAGKRGGGFFGNTIYGTSKAGVIALTKGLAREGGPYGIYANAICPGGTDTNMLDNLDSDARTNIINSIPLRKFAKPEDIAHVALFLTSDLAGHVTGEITDVDGGVMLD